MSKKRKILIFLGIVLILAVSISFLVINKENLFRKRATKLKQVEGLTIVPTMNDKITQDSSWCGTFQLVWNDMKNEVVKRDIVFNPQLDMVKNLNMEDFNESMLSEDYYFKIYGRKTLELKKQIEDGIQEKFNQSSDVLDSIDWNEDALDDSNNSEEIRYLFYAMLYRKFEYKYQFDKLENDKFGKKYKDVQYFGIDKNTKDKVRDQINVLYYNSKDDFALLINTKKDDEVIFCKSPQGDNFNEIYDNMNKESNKYTGKREFTSYDEFKAPNLTFNEQKEYTELEGKKFETNDPDYPVAKIEKTIQSIQFSLDEKGGEIKSEAIIDMTVDDSSGVTKEKREPRYFYVDDTFALFLREKGKEKPYFAGRIDNIKKFQ